MTTYLIEIKRFHLDENGEQQEILGYFVGNFDNEDQARSVNLSEFHSPFQNKLDLEDYRILWEKQIRPEATGFIQTGNVYTVKTSPWIDPYGYMQVEVDTSYTGGDYYDTGTFENVPTTLIKQVQDVTMVIQNQIEEWNLPVALDEPFETAAALWLGVDPVNIISRNEDDIFDLDGEQLN